MLSLFLLLLLPLLASAFAPVDLADLDAQLSPESQLLFPESPKFPGLTARFTSLGRPTASAVLLAGCEADISVAVRFAGDRNITFFVQNAGHGWNVRMADRLTDALFINVSKLNTVRVDAAANTATVGGGAMIADFQKSLQDAGKQVTVPSCDCIGVAGPALGGGVGRLQGNYGLMLDNILSLRVVLADGRIVTASATKNPDLFWAMRGAGHNFGVVTEMVFKVYEAVPDNLHYNLDLFIPRKNLEKAFEWLLERHEGSGLRPGLSLTLIYANDGKGGDPFFLINFVFAGSQEEGRAIAEPLRRLSSSISLEERLKWTDLPAKGGLGLAAALCPYGDRYSMFGIDTKKLDPVTQGKVFDEYVSMLREYPQANGTALLFQSHAQEKMHSIEPWTTAFPHRESNLFSVMTIKYPDASLDAPMRGFGKKIRQMIRDAGGYAKPRVYVNYAWGDEDQQTKFGYEPWRLARLRQLKKKYDPRKQFSGYNAIE